MSQTLNITNFGSLNILSRTTLIGDLPAGQSAVPVQNSDDFVVGSMLIGNPGSPAAEMVTISSVAAGSITLSAATVNPHNNSDPLFMLFGNQIRVYGAADQYQTGQQPDDDTFALLSGGTISIDGGKSSTAFTDPVGAAGTWYKFTYRNSTSTDETNLSDSKAVQSGQVHYVSIDQIRRAAGFADSPNVTDDIISEKRAQAEKEINGALLPVYNFPLPQPTNPIIEQIALHISAGELMHELYVTISPAMAAEGEAKAALARSGGGSITSLAELVSRDVVLEDAKFNELTIEEGHGFGGYPDDTSPEPRQFHVDMEY